ncbi:MAG: S8 family serine peptidase [Halobacteriota archaeon]
MILGIAVFAAVTGIASAQTYNESGNYIEGINVSVNTSDNVYFNRSCINVPLTFQINTLNASATNFSVDNQSGLTTNATGGDLAANEWFWVNASIPGTYWVNVSNNDNQSEYVNFTVEYSNITITIEKIEIKPETLNLGSKGVFTAFITLPEGCYDVADINVSTVKCEGVGLADLKKRIDGDNRFIAKFKREELVYVLNETGKVDGLNKTGNNVTLNVTWKLDDGTPFEGNDTIRVINRGRWGLGFLPGNPLNEVKKWAKRVHKKFSTSDDDAIAMPGNPGEATERVFVSGSPTSTSIVKNTFAVQHEFEDGFTVAVSAKGLAALKKIPKIQLEAVPLYHVLGKPVCGNDIIEGGEKCGELGLPNCPSGYVCENCKCVEETAPPERACYPSVQKPWGIVKVNGGSGGAEVKVAVLDTGVYKDHLDLKANIVDCIDATKRGIRKGCADDNGHGTHVAGTILADGGGDGKGIFGVAPEAKLMAIKVCGPGGCWADDIAAGIRYAADNGANIISMSLGGDAQSRLIKDAIDYAVVEKGVLVVAAAGNDGPVDG